MGGGGGWRSVMSLRVCRTWLGGRVEWGGKEERDGEGRGEEVSVWAGGGCVGAGGDECQAPLDS